MLTRGNYSIKLQTPQSITEKAARKETIMYKTSDLKNKVVRDGHSGNDRERF